MPTPIISAQWPRFLLPIVRNVWYAALGNAPSSPAFQFYNVQSSTRPVEYSQGIGGIGLIPEYNSASAEGAPAAIPYGSFSPLYETTFTHKEYALGLAIERKLVDDDQQGLIKRQVQTHGDAAGITRAYWASSLLNNAFSASYLGGDGVALASTVHPVNKTSSSTYSNKGTTALSYAAVVAALIAGHDMDDDNGFPRPIMYDTLYIPTALQATAYEITKALAKPGTADNDANFLGSRGLQVVVDPYLTDANNWFLIDSSMSKMHMLWFNRVLPEITLDPASDFNLVARYRQYMRFSFGWDDARFIYGAEVA